MAPKASDADPRGPRERKYDPILDDPISSDDDSAGSEGSEGEGSDEALDIEFPRENSQELMTFLHREVTNLSNMDDPQKRKFALVKLYQVFVLAKNKATPQVYSEILTQIQKLLFKRMSDKVEKNRELACLIIKEFFTQVDDLTLSIPYLFPVLVDRLNAEDLEGVDGLPDEMKPSKSQKAHVMIDPPEDSEEVRILIAELMTIIVSSTVFDCLRPYVDNIVNILRALCMDPAGQVVIEGCAAMREFAVLGGDQLLHFSENMGRALFTSFVHKHAKVRIAGLKTLFDVCVCGQWKFSVDIMSLMIGFRDPNIVPIKEFYEPSTKTNYFALFVADRSTQARECFYKTMGDMLMRLPDKIDHEGRLFPYLISGLYDHNDAIKEVVFEVIEDLGEQHERENEEKFREVKQLGFNSEWTLNGLLRDVSMPLPYPMLHRPRLGSRVQVRSYVRRYIKAIQHEVTDWIEENAERASHLLLFSIIYAEEFMTQFLDQLLVAMYKVVNNKENKAIRKNIPLAFKLLGRYCMPYSYEQLVMTAIKNELASHYPYTQAGALKAFGYLFTGAIELLPEAKYFTKVESLLTNFVQTVKDYVIDALDQELAEILVQTLNEVADSLIAKQEAGMDIKYVAGAHLYDMLKMGIQCLGVFQSFKLAGKPDPTNIVESKALVTALIGKLGQLSDEPDQDYLDLHLA